MFLVNNTNLQPILHRIHVIVDNCQIFAFGLFLAHSFGVNS